MNIYKSAEDYLEQILMLLEQKGHARSVDIAAGLNVSKPSVSVAMKKLRENGYISMSSDSMISLTDKGYAIARKIYDRHLMLTRFLIQIGVPEEIAREDAELEAKRKAEWEAKRSAGEDGDDLPW
jgi:Mn-dependent DtxR family transcriptional regulator